MLRAVASIVTIVVTAAISLAGCVWLRVPDMDPAFASATLDGVRLDQEREVAVQDWLTTHRSRWEIIVVTPPPDADQTVDLAYPDGQHVALSIYAGRKYPAWRNVVVVFADDPKRVGMQNFSDKDFADLARALKL